jgi:hypothetical protein
VGNQWSHGGIAIYSLDRIGLKSQIIHNYREPAFCIPYQYSTWRGQIIPVGLTSGWFKGKETAPSMLLRRSMIVCGFPVLHGPNGEMRFRELAYRLVH